MSIKITIRGIDCGFPRFVTVKGFNGIIPACVHWTLKCTHSYILDDRFGVRFFTAFGLECLIEIIEYIIDYVQPHCVSFRFITLQEGDIACVLVGAKIAINRLLKISGIFAVIDTVEMHDALIKKNISDSNTIAAVCAMNDKEFNNAMNANGPQVAINFRVCSEEYDRCLSVWNSACKFAFFELVQVKYVSILPKNPSGDVDVQIIKKRNVYCDSLFKLCLLEANKYGLPNTGWYIKNE